MQLTQEKKFFLQKARLKTVEQTMQELDDIETNNLIDKYYIEDLLHQICNNKESDFQQEISETGTYYFFNDYRKEFKK